jgi:hypothetical protein
MRKKKKSGSSSRFPKERKHSKMWKSARDPAGKGKFYIKENKKFKSPI